MKAQFLWPFLSMGLASPGQAEPPACSCKNLSDLQGEYKNAVYLEGYMQGLAAHQKALEERLKGLKLSTNADPDQNLDIVAASNKAREAYEKANLKLPVSPVWDHGPSRVSMIPRTCTQSAPELQALANGAVCGAVAEAVLAHEARHRALCEEMGIEAYWGRMPSEISVEEAREYKLQAEAIKAELRRVLDASRVELIGEWRYTIDAQGQMVAGYVNQTQSGDIGGASGDDVWTMTGKGTTSGRIESFVAAGMTCQPGGSINHDFDVAMTTDGLTFGIESRETRTAGDVTLTCPGGIGMSMPTQDSGSGFMTTGQALYAGDNVLPNDWAGVIKAMMTAAGVSITGEPEMILRVSCPELQQ